MAKKFDEMIKELYDRFVNGVVAIIYPNRRVDTDTRTVRNVGQLQSLSFIDFGQRLKGPARHIRFTVSENCLLSVYKTDDTDVEAEIREPILSGVQYRYDEEDISKIKVEPVGGVFPFTITWYASR